MPTLRRWRGAPAPSSLVSTLALLSLLSSGVARAQDASETPASATSASPAGATPHLQAPEGEGGPAPSGGVVPPVLLAQPEAVYPPEALAAGLEGAVKLLLTLDAEGRVSRAEVVEGLGHGLDEAAVSALENARFSPAMQDGNPVPCQFEFIHHFVLARPPEAAPPGAEEVAQVAPDAPAEEATAQPSEEPAPPAAPGFTSVVRARSTEARALVRGSEAVDVVELEKAHERAEDLAEVLTRASAVQVQRTGGMGSRTQLSLGGLSGDQVRVLLDGVPIEYSPYVYGLGSVPVSLIRQLEVFNGVVPVRLATDALGGAIHLRSDLAKPETGASLSLQGGSFGSYRGTGRLTWRAHEHVFVRAAGFHDRAQNDYVITVPVDDLATGRVSPRALRRNHDAYRGTGGDIEVGFESLPGIDRLVLNGYLGRYDKEVPHDQFMIQPYGAVTSAQESWGLGLRYEVSPHERLKVLAIAGYNQRVGELLDASDCLYDWYGACRATRARAGETGSTPLENTQTRQTLFGRVRLLGTLLDPEDLEVSLGVDDSDRSGENAYLTRLQQEDPLRVPLALTSAFGGLSHRQLLWDGRLENTVFVKGYLQRFASGTRQEAAERRWAGGFGDTLRFSLRRGLLLKASYERTTRMPRVDEIFGDGGLLVENSALVPESSHNANLGVELLPIVTSVGRFGANAVAGVRDVENLIQLFPGDATQAYENVDHARSFSAHAGVDWDSPGDWVGLTGTVTWLDFRNLAREGQFARFHGDRMPNIPWLQASATARFQKRQLLSAQDALGLEWTTRFVESFFRSWESAGRGGDKARVPTQVLHFAALTYRSRFERRAFSFSFNLQNLTDAPAFDIVGVQKPGRAFSVRATVDL
ncbi:TonB-dependent siderophore myxochelin receptor MxcH [Myxococcus virescens]|uniref:Outer membrane transport energization protein TonB n=1 Tax=Myxococcus virescens TaxID=83456 RepID=A0ABY0N7D2_9BACT|nr:TonB-dependent siderophore myxochelin receptor MxcH [Myxococcus virescens]SDF06711.1 outer membrane transport energization protein TonB [Myxococcus virescens]